MTFSIRLIVSVSGLRSPFTYRFTAGCVTLIKVANADCEIPAWERYLASFIPPYIPFWYLMYSPSHTENGIAPKKTFAYDRMMSVLRKLREASGLSQLKLAELADTTQATIARLEKGDRKLSMKWAEALAPHLGVDPQAIMFPDQSSFARVVSAPIVGTIKAGSWLEAHASEELGRMPIVDTEGYAPELLYVLNVDGDSMDEFVKDGGYVVCVNVIGGRVRFRTGMVVHVERRRFGGELIETTLKEIRVLAEGMELIPRSSNPAHKTIVLDGSDGDEIEIKGLVLGRYDPAPVR